MKENVRELATFSNSRENIRESNLHPSDLCWNAYRSQAGFSAITSLFLNWLDPHL